MSPEEANLRPAVNPSNSCAACAFFDQGNCAALGIKTNPTQVCDAFQLPESGDALQAQMEDLLFMPGAGSAASKGGM